MLRTYKVHTSYCLHPVLPNKLFIETSLVLSAINKASVTARNLADICFYAVESGIVVIDRMLTMCKDQLYGKPSSKKKVLNLQTSNTSEYLDIQTAEFIIRQRYSAMQLEKILKDARDVILPFCQQVSGMDILFNWKLKNCFSWNVPLVASGRIEMHPLHKHCVVMSVLF